MVSIDREMIFFSRSVITIEKGGGGVVVAKLVEIDDVVAIVLII